MDKKAISRFAVGLISILFLTAFLLAFPLGMSATEDEQTTTSNVTVNVYAAVALSTNLTDGIQFGSLDPNTNDNNATHNFDKDGAVNSSMWIEISNDCNTNLSLWIKDDVALTKGSDTIANTGYTYASNTTVNNETDPGLAGTAITTAYVLVSAVAEIGQNYTFRGWLDIPSGQAAGYYSNTVYFKGNQTI